MLRGWRSWGAMPQVFEPGNAIGVQLTHLLSEREMRAAARTTLNAHYTDPRYAAAIWATAIALGFDGGRVLEPGCGSGIFIDTAPAGVHVTGIEVDPVTAEIASRLHPGATIRAESFAETPLPENTFDLAIGNVPFADITLHDPRHNAGRLSMHNHFIVKSLALVRPGGLVLVLTSRYTMDALGDGARRVIAQDADLLGAVRLPSGAHRRFAGTDAVTDLVVLRKRMPGEQSRAADWLTVDREAFGADLPVNTYWRSHPGMVLGQLRRSGHGMYGGPNLLVDGEASGENLADRGRQIAQSARAAGLGFVPAPRERADAAPEALAVDDGRGGLYDGHVEQDTSGQWTQLVGGRREPIEVPAAHARELAHLVQVRDAVLTVLRMEAGSRDDTSELHDARDRLAARYASYVDRYGPINRVRVIQTSRVDKDGDPIVQRRFPTAVRLLASIDPHAATVRALEIYDETTGEASPAAIISRRVLAPTLQRDRADTPADALAICLDQTGRVDLDVVARLLSTSAQTARERLGELVFDDPVSRQLVPAAQYLSGNVRIALAAAQAAAEDDPRYLVNVAALTKVIPVDLEPDEIHAAIGSIWIPPTDLRDFLRETLNDYSAQVEHLGGANWKIRNGSTHSLAATATWGTDRIPAQQIIERLACQKRIVVHDVVENLEGRQIEVVNPVATEAAVEKAEALQARFAEWIWQDPDRAQRLARVYNDTFNALVLRSYDRDGQRLTLPGLSGDFTPHPHQRSAVARMISEPSVGLFHAVGAGKTAEMVMGATELRRLGLVNKPCVVVPNHMLEQFTREWLQLYPAAHVLTAASEDLRGDNRRVFIARAATGEWDGILLTQGAFGSIAVSPAGQRTYLEQQIDITREQLVKAREARVSSLTIRQMEKTIQRVEERTRRLMDHKVDPGLTWEETGIDYLILDELHMYKNLAIVSNIRDVAKDGSQRATDLDMKLSLLRAAAGDGGRVMTGATATPIANSMAEAWVMQRYLRPDLLLDAGLTDFDSWAATFGKTVTKMEMSPAGDRFRLKDRFASFQNLPELLQMWHVPADVKTGRDLALSVPLIAADASGRRVAQIVAIPLSDAQQAFMGELKDRAEKVQNRLVEPTEDNMLKISSDGRKAGLDLRLLQTLPAAAADTLLDQASKVDVAAMKIAQIWRAHRQDTFPGSSRPGSLQIVFCDLGTPHPDRWNVYDALRDALVERGLDQGRIRFVHEAKNDDAKGRLFAQCRAGDVDVLIGSTAKMGVGTNIQTRAIALHHLDCPWRPADVEQREGRIIRQGNSHPEVHILRYVTEGSFDAFMWQGVARKAGFIDQVMHGRVDQRSADDIDSGAEEFDYTTVAAVASGNPLLLERADAAAEVEKLSRLEAGHARAQRHRSASVAQLTRQIDTLAARIPLLEEVAERSVPTTAEAFTASIGGRRVTDRVQAGHALAQVLATHASGIKPWRPTIPVPGLAQLGGHHVDASLKQATTAGAVTLTVAVSGLGDLAAITMDAATIGDGRGLVTRLENLVASLPERAAALQRQIDSAQRDADEARTGLGAPFPRAGELATARARLQNIEERLAKTPENDTAPPPSTQRPHDPPDTGRESGVPFR